MSKKCSKREWEYGIRNKKLGKSQNLKYELHENFRVKCKNPQEKGIGRKVNFYVFYGA